MSGTGSRWSVDLYSDGVCVYELDAYGEIDSVVTWARNSGTAKAAFEELCQRLPKTSFSRRRRSHMEADGVIDTPQRQAKLATIRFLIDHEKSLTVHCRGCGRHVILDLKALG